MRGKGEKRTETDMEEKYMQIIQDMKRQLAEENRIILKNELEFVLLMNALRSFEMDLDSYIAVKMRREQE